MYLHEKKFYFYLEKEGLSRQTLNNVLTKWSESLKSLISLKKLNLTKLSIN